MLLGSREHRHRIPSTSCHWSATAARRPPLRVLLHVYPCATGPIEWLVKKRQARTILSRH